jgi:tryptophanyl-tRNA synthetase
VASGEWRVISACLLLLCLGGRCVLGRKSSALFSFVSASAILFHSREAKLLSNTIAATKRVLSGMRPTGRLHIGHYFGALQNWVRLQNETLLDTAHSSSPLATRHPPLPSYECFYFVADWHALTSDYADTSGIAENSLQITIDYLAAGLDPQKSVVFLQSLIPEHAELHLLLSMITPLGWLERIPTYKEQIDNITNKDLHTYGFLGYPTLQTADIVMYSDPGKALFVPVGEDQVSHVEFSRELVRRFNNFYGWKIKEERLLATDSEPLVRLLYNHLFRYWSDGAPEFPRGPVTLEVAEWVKRAVPQAASLVGVRNLLGEPNQFQTLVNHEPVLEEPGHLLTPTPRVPGLDGRKMSKSYGNAITLSESDEAIRKKTKVMVTDPARKRRTDPGNPDVCPVFDWHKLFSTPERDPGRLDWVRTGCTTAGIGCIECKAAMADNLIKWIAPIRERRLHYEQNPKQALEILESGSATARNAARQTMSRVRDSIFHWPSKRSSL